MDGLFIERVERSGTSMQQKDLANEIEPLSSRVGCCNASRDVVWVGNNKARINFKAIRNH